MLFWHGGIHLKLLVLTSPTPADRPMNDFDDLPIQNPAQHIQDEAEAAFEQTIRTSNLFDWQQKDRRDYGTDYQIEAIKNNRRTNIRLHIQLKGTEKQNKETSTTIQRSNLNYLITQPFSLYVCYDLKTKKLYAKTAEDVFRSQRSRDSEKLKIGKTIKIKFTKELDLTFLAKLHGLSISTGTAERNRRLDWQSTPPSKLQQLIKRNARPIPVPFDEGDAYQKLIHLYRDMAADDIISASYDQFHAVLSNNPEAVRHLYMAEINLGLNGSAFDKARVQDAIASITSDISNRKITPISGLYTLGNAWSVLGDKAKAKSTYEEALAYTHGNSAPKESFVASQCWKNYGSVLYDLGHPIEAKSAYEQALLLDPDLAEAHFALGVWHTRNGSDPAVALEHFDSVSKSIGSSLSMHLVNAWRAQALFQMNQEGSAFNAINSVLDSGELSGWEWAWAARLVSTHRYDNMSSARKSLHFWRRYLLQHPGHIHAQIEEFNCLWWIHQETGEARTSFEEMTKLAEAIARKEESAAGRIWDQLGHWAQRENDWIAAEAAYRRAFTIDKSYTYCLAKALNTNGKYEETLAILDTNNDSIIADALGHFELAFAREHLGDVMGAIAAYSRAVEIDPDYDVAHFNLGGLFWNKGDMRAALNIWKAAVARFPNHESADRLRKDLPAFFPPNDEG